MIVPFEETEQKLIADIHDLENRIESTWIDEADRVQLAQMVIDGRAALSVLQAVIGKWRRVAMSGERGEAA